MISEANYVELMKNCAKWNERAAAERKSRFRYPYFDQQTGVAHRPIHNYYKTADQRFPSTDPNVYIQYKAPRWKKRAHQPSDAIETKMFLRDNPQLEATINHMTQAYTTPEVSTADLSMDLAASSKSTPKQFEDYSDDLDDDLSNGSGSDEDDWGSKRKRGRQASAKKKKASAGRPPQSHACSKCSAKFKSQAGVTYHKAFVHGEPLLAPLNCLMTPSLEASDYCDLCLGSKYMNKISKKAEDLVSCHDCGRSGHPSCLKFGKNVPFVINRYGWQCIECKSCTICGTSDNDAMLLFCDDCDRGFHLYCLRPPLEKAPEGEYSCALCLHQFGPNASAPPR